MTDNDTLSDAELVRLVAAKDNELAKLVQARLRRLRLARVVTPTPLQRAVSPLVAHVERELRKG